jgi:methyl-accepting chemotaxis protein
MAGDTVLNGDADLVDTVQRLVGGVATVFMGDMRVATNVLKRDGSRATGTPLAPGPVYDAIFHDGKDYRGKADILGETYFTGYEPIKNSADTVIGILFVGVKASTWFHAVDLLIYKLAALTVLIVVIVGTALFVFVRGQFSGLSRIRQAMGALSAGHLSTPIPELDRHDEIGEMARATQTFKENARQAEDLRENQRKEQESRARRAEAITTLAEKFDQAIASVIARLPTRCPIEQGPWRPPLTKPRRMCRWSRVPPKN